MPGLDRIRPLTDSRPIYIDAFVGLTPEVCRFNSQDTNGT